MSALIINYINEASISEKYLINSFLKKRFDSISEEEIFFWITKMQKKNIIEKTIDYLHQVIKKSINISEKNGREYTSITKFIIKNILSRISKKIV